MIETVLLIKAEGGAERRKEKEGVKEQKEEELEKEERKQERLLAIKIAAFWLIPLLFLQKADLTFLFLSFPFCKEGMGKPGR